MLYEYFKIFKIGKIKQINIFIWYCKVIDKYKCYWFVLIDSFYINNDLRNNQNFFVLLLVITLMLNTKVMDGRNIYLMHSILLMRLISFENFLTFLKYYVKQNLNFYEWQTIAGEWLKIIMKCNTIRCKKLVTIVSGQKNVAQNFFRRK